MGVCEVQRHRNVEPKCGGWRVLRFLYGTPVRRVTTGPPEKVGSLGPVYPLFLPVEFRAVCL